MSPGVLLADGLINTGIIEVYTGHKRHPHRLFTNCGKHGTKLAITSNTSPFSPCLTINERRESTTLHTNVCEVHQLSIESLPLQQQQQRHSVRNSTCNKRPFKPMKDVQLPIPISPAACSRFACFLFLFGQRFAHIFLGGRRCINRNTSTCYTTRRSLFF